MNICNLNLTPDEIKAKEKLISDILSINPSYTRDLVERAIISCCTESKGQDASIDCVTKRTKQFHLIDFKP